MESILSQIFFGKIIPFEYLVPKDEEYPSVAETVDKESEYLKNTLSTEDYAHFENYEEMQGLISNMTLNEAFIRGFRLAARIMIEVCGSSGDMEELLKLLRNNKNL